MKDDAEDRRTSISRRTFAQRIGAVAATVLAGGAAYRALQTPHAPAPAPFGRERSFDLNKEAQLAIHARLESQGRELDAAHIKQDENSTLTREQYEMFERLWLAVDQPNALAAEARKLAQAFPDVDGQAKIVGRLVYRVLHLTERQAPMANILRAFAHASVTADQIAFKRFPDTYVSMSNEKLYVGWQELVWQGWMVSAIVRRSEKEDLRSDKLRHTLGDQYSIRKGAEGEVEAILQLAGIAPLPSAMLRDIPDSASYRKKLEDTLHTSTVRQASR